MGVIHDGIIPQRDRLQSYLTGDLAELENYLWARVEFKLLKKKAKLQCGKIRGLG